MSGEEPGYVPPDHKTTAEFRVPGRAAAPDAGTEADSTIVDEPVYDLADATFQDFPVDDPVDDPAATSQDLPVDDPVGDPAATFQDLPGDDPEDYSAATSQDFPVDDPVDDPAATSQDLPVDDPEDDPAATFQDSPVHDPEDDPAATFQDLPGDGPEVMFRDLPGDASEAPDPPEGDPGVTFRDAPEKASATVTDIRIEKPVPPQEEEAAFEQGAVPAAATAERPAPAPVGGEAPWTERFGAGPETPGAPAIHYALPSAGLGTGPQPDATAPAMPSGGVPAARSRRPIIFAGVIGVVLLIAAAAVVALLLTRGGSDGNEGKTAQSPSPAASAPVGAGGGPAAGEPAPSEAPATPPAGGQPPVQQPGTPPPATTAPIGPLVQGKGITYQLVQQDEGYFEGKIVITNRTDRPMKTWKLTFRAPGADVKNIWGARLVRGGEKVEIENLDGAPAIPPGATWEVQYGAAGPASTPKGCEINGKACGF